LQTKGRLMIFAEGQTVRFIYTGDQGVIERLEGDLAQVRLPDGDLIPVPLENLESPDTAEKQKAQASDPSGSYQGPIPIEDVPGLAAGMYLVFNLAKRQGPFEYGLLNMTQTEGLISTKLAALHHTAQSKNGKIGKRQYLPLGEMPFNWLGDSANFLLEAWEQQEKGTGKKVQGKVKIKVSHFFDNPMAIEELGNANFRSYLLFKDWKPKSDRQAEDLRTYTKNNLQWDNFERIMEQNEVQAKAVFPTEIDLHIEKLTTHHDKLGNLEILKTQIRHFEKYMAEASKVGVDRVFIIHGLGKGKLRAEIHSRLGRYTRVTSFKNDYHPAFGWGATEVNFG